MTPETLGNVAVTQLENIMLHADLMGAYAAAGMPKEAARHQKIALDEMSCHLKTCTLYAMETGKLYRPAIQVKPFPVTEAETKKAEYSGIDRDALHKRLLGMWHEAEIKAACVYADAMKSADSCLVWYKLKQTAEAEIRHIENEMKKC